VRITCRKGCLGLGPNIALSLLDLSETGARLLVTESLAEKEEVELTLIAPGLTREVKHLGRVIWALTTAEGHYCIGIQFEKRLNYGTLTDLSRLAGA
jgi:hypothetical protein